MNTHVAFNVYAQTLDEIQRAAYAELARFSGTDFQWDIAMEITVVTSSGDGRVTHWKGEVSAWPKQDKTNWRDGP